MNKISKDFFISSFLLEVSMGYLLVAQSTDTRCSICGKWLPNLEELVASGLVASGVFGVSDCLERSSFVLWSCRRSQPSGHSTSNLKALGCLCRSLTTSKIPSSASSLTALSMVLRESPPVHLLRLLAEIEKEKVLAFKWLVIVIATSFTAGLRSLVLSGQCSVKRRVW